MPALHICSCILARCCQFTRQFFYDILLKYRTSQYNLNTLNRILNLNILAFRLLLNRKEEKSGTIKGEVTKPIKNTHHPKFC